MRFKNAPVLDIRTIKLFLSKRKLEGWKVGLVQCWILYSINTDAGKAWRKWTAVADIHCAFLKFIFNCNCWRQKKIDKQSRQMACLSQYRIFWEKLIQFLIDSGPNHRVSLFLSYSLTFRPLNLVITKIFIFTHHYYTKSQSNRYSWMEVHRK